MAHEHREGDVVVVLGKTTSKSRVAQPNELLLGTYVMKLADKKAMVLLADSCIFVGNEYEIVPVSEQLSE
jgi:hypothetical protein